MLFSAIVGAASGFVVFKYGKSAQSAAVIGAVSAVLASIAAGAIAKNVASGAR